MCVCVFLSMRVCVRVNVRVWVRALARSIGLRRDGAGVGRWLETGAGVNVAGAWLGPESCSQQVAPKASPTWPCGEVVAELHLTGWRLSGCAALLPELLRGGIWLLDSALVTCSLQKKKKKKKKKKLPSCGFGP